MEGADWAHMALHGDLETDSLVLAIPRGTADQGKHVKMVVSLPCSLEKFVRDFAPTFGKVVAAVALVEPKLVSITVSEIQSSTRIEVRVSVPQEEAEESERG